MSKSKQKKDPNIRKIVKKALGKKFQIREDQVLKSYMEKVPKRDIAQTPAVRLQISERKIDELNEQDLTDSDESCQKHMETDLQNRHMETLSKITHIKSLRNYFDKIQYPISKDSLLEHLGAQDPDLHEKFKEISSLLSQVSNHNIVNKSTVTEINPDEVKSEYLSRPMQRYLSNEEVFTVFENMSEREKLIVLKDYLNSMIQLFVLKVPESNLSRVENSMLLVSYVLSTVSKEDKKKIREKSYVLERTLSLMFDSISCMLKAFDVIMKDNSVVNKLRGEVKSHKSTISSLEQEIQALNAKILHQNDQNKQLRCQVEGLKIENSKCNELFLLQQKLSDSVMKTNIKGYKEYSKEQVKVMKHLVDRIKQLQNQQVQMDDSYEEPDVPRFVIDYKENSSEETNQLEVSIDQYDQILEEKNQKIEQEYKGFTQENQQFWKLTDESPEYKKIREILDWNLALEQCEPTGNDRKRSKSFSGQPFKATPVYFKPPEEIPKCYCAEMAIQATEEQFDQEVQTEIEMVAMEQVLNGQNIEARSQNSNSQGSDIKLEHRQNSNLSSQNSGSDLGLDSDPDLEFDEGELAKSGQTNLPCDAKTAGEHKEKSLKMAAELMKFWVKKTIARKQDNVNPNLGPNEQQIVSKSKNDSHPNIGQIDEDQEDENGQGVNETEQPLGVNIETRLNKVQKARTDSTRIIDHSLEETGKIVNHLHKQSLSQERFVTTRHSVLDPRPLETQSVGIQVNLFPKSKFSSTKSIDQVMDKVMEEDLQPKGRATASRRASRKIKLKGLVSTLSSQNQTTSHAKTSLKPFQFSHKTSEKPGAHPVNKLVTNVMKKYNSKSRKPGGNPKGDPLRSVLKIITEVNEKAIQISEGGDGQKVSKLEVLYDIYYTKYGIDKLTNKKFRAILLTILKNCRRVAEIEQFAKDIGIDMQ